MKIPTAKEVLRLTRFELLRLEAEILREVDALPAFSAELAEALECLDNIRAARARLGVRARRGPPGPQP